MYIRRRYQNVHLTWRFYSRDHPSLQHSDYLIGSFSLLGHYGNCAIVERRWMWWKWAVVIRVWRGARFLEGDDKWESVPSFRTVEDFVRSLSIVETIFQVIGVFILGSSKKSTNVSEWVTLQDFDGMGRIFVVFCLVVVSTLLVRSALPHMLAFSQIIRVKNKPDNKYATHTLTLLTRRRKCRTYVG